MFRKTNLLVTAVALIVTASSQAQPAGELNRSVEGISIEPASPGLYVIHVVHQLAAKGTVDLSNDVRVTVNGTTVAVFQEDLSYSGSSNGCSDNDACAGCGSGFSCFVGVPVLGCACGALTSNSTGPVPIPTGSNVTAWIMPARSGAPETHTNDDVKEVFFDGLPTYWNRSIESVEFHETRGGPTATWDIVINKKTATRGIAEPTDLSSIIQVVRLSDGAVLASVDSLAHHNNISPCVAEVPDDPGDCTSSCGTGDIDDIIAFPMECELYFQSGEHPVCQCAANASIFVPGLTIPEGDGIRVTMIPAPGALPELPGLEEDDEREEMPGRTCGDFDGDGDTDLGDFSVFSLCYAGANNPPAATCPPGVDADFDDDGDVDLGDFAEFSLCYSGPQ